MNNESRMKNLQEIINNSSTSFLDKRRAKQKLAVIAARQPSIFNKFRQPVFHRNPRFNTISKNNIENMRTQNKAASKIQAAVRGQQTRRKNNAASKIQAAFRGHQTRRNINKRRKAATKIKEAYKRYKINSITYEKFNNGNTIYGISSNKDRRDGVTFYLKKNALEKLMRNKFTNNNNLYNKLIGLNPNLKRNDAYSYYTRKNFNNMISKIRLTLKNPVSREPIRYLNRYKFKNGKPWEKLNSTNLKNLISLTIKQLTNRPEIKNKNY